MFRDNEVKVSWVLGNGQSKTKTDSNGGDSHIDAFAIYPTQPFLPPMINNSDNLAVTHNHISATYMIGHL